MRARSLIGMHYGTFDLSDEPPDEPPRRFREAGVKARYDTKSILTPPIGETKRF